MLSLVLCDGVPKPFDGLFFIADAFLHGIQVYGLGTIIQLVLKHVHHGVDHDRTVDVLLHAMYAQLQVFACGLSP